MRFDYRTESIRTDALTLDYFLVPWDTQILDAPVGQIADLRVLEPIGAAKDYGAFDEWCVSNRIALCACRLPADRVADSMFLEDRGFRFVELNYLPRLDGLQQLCTGDEGIEVAPAEAGDREVLVDMAARAFRHGRLHQDPRIDPRLGDKRYAAWVTNAFASSNQQVVKCSAGRQIVAFFVIENREPKHVFWSLNALAPGLGGQGLGKRVWRSMLHWHRARGAETVSTSISSHNLPAFNLYVALGFRFPLPMTTWHWLSTSGSL